MDDKTWQHPLAPLKQTNKNRVKLAYPLLQCLRCLIGREIADPAQMACCTDGLVFLMWFLNWRHSLIWWTGVLKLLTSTKHCLCFTVLNDLSSLAFICPWSVPHIRTASLKVRKDLVGGAEDHSWEKWEADPGSNIFSYWGLQWLNLCAYGRLGSTWFVGKGQLAVQDMGPCILVYNALSSWPHSRELLRHWCLSTLRCSRGVRWRSWTSWCQDMWPFEED